MAKEKKSKFDINFAEDPAIAEKVSGHFVPRIRLVRTERLQLEETWWRFFNMWNVTKDGYHNYNGRAQLYVPEVRKNVEAQARQLTKSAFPTEDCFDVGPGLTGTRKGALAWKSVHKWSMDNCALPLKYFVAMRQQCLLGTTVAYVPWRKDTRYEFRSRRDGKKIAPARQKIDLFNGPDFVVRDMFRWYTFNPKIRDLSDGCFEIMAQSPFQLLKLRKAGLLANYDKILGESGSAYSQEEFNRDIMRAESEGILIDYNRGYAGEAVIKKDGDDDSISSVYMRTRIFSDMVLPEACEDDEDPEMPIPMMIDIYGNSTCGLIQRNPFYHQQPPYVLGRYIAPNADEFYGQGIPWAIQYMQYELNSKVEQGMDSATMANNPIAIIDPGLAGASNEFDIEPGAKWWANPAGVKLTSMPDTSAIAYAAVNQLRQQMADYSDRSPALPPQLMGKSRSATQSEIVFDSMGVDNWLFQLSNECEMLVPLFQQWESLTDQNMDDKMMVMILGRRAADLRRTMLSRSDLLGRYVYTWKGASASASKQILARQMLDALKVITMMPPQQLQGLNFNFGEFIKFMWSSVWSLPDADKILGVPEEMATQDATTENEMVKMGLEIEVLPTDDDDAHMPVHDKEIAEIKDETKKTLLMAHNVEHKNSKERKQLMAQQYQQQMQLQMLMAQQQQNGGRKQGSGNRSQLSPNANAGNIASGVRP